MGIELLTERHGDQIAGVLGCWDRMLIFGTLPKICFAGGMTSFLFERNIRIFDYPRFAEPFRNRIRENAEKLAADTGVEIEFIRKRNFRKEERVKEALAKRGEHPGMVCIFSVMEPCSTYKPWHNKQTGKTYLVPDDGKCLHYYFYFVDEGLGLCQRAGADMAALPPADLLQWAQLAGGPTEQVRHRLSNDRQRLHTYSRLAAGTAALQRLGNQTHSHATERSSPAVLPNL